MPNKGGFRFTPDDEDILVYVFNASLANVSHLSLLTGRPRRAVQRRLELLTKHGFLYRRRFASTEPYLYTIDKEALPALLDREVATEAAVKKRLLFRRGLRERSGLFVPHDLIGTHIYAVLEAAARVTPFPVARWIHESDAIRDGVTLRENGKLVKLPVRPDRFLSIEDTRRRDGRTQAHFLIETERKGKRADFRNKVRAFWHYYQSGLHTKRFGIRRFRVLTVTLTQEHAESWCETARKVLPAEAHGMFFFAPLSAFPLDDPKRVHDAVFFTPRDYTTSRRYTLIQPLAKP